MNKKKYNLRRFLFGKIGTKLILAFLLIALVIAINSFFIIVKSFKEQNIIYNEIYKSIFYINNAWRLMEAVEHQRIAANQYLFLEKSLKEERANYFEEKEKTNLIIQSYNTEPDKKIKLLIKGFSVKVKEYNDKLEEAFALHDQKADLNIVKEKIKEANVIEEEIHKNYLKKIIEYVQNKHIEPAEKDIANATIKMINNILILNIFTIILAVFLGLFISRSISNPIKKLRDAVLEIGKGNFDAKIEVKSNDEIGELAFAFNQMANDLKRTRAEIEAYNKNLEIQVAEKTKRLTKVLKKAEKDKKELEKQRLATLNILEDISESQKKLQTLNFQLEKRKFELESLKSLNEELTTVFSIEELLDVVSKYLQKILKNSVCLFAIYDQLRDEIFVKSYLFESVSKQVFDDIYGELFTYLKEKINFSEKIKDNIRLVFEGKINNKNKEYPKASFILPFRAGDNFLGAVHVSFLKVDESYQERQSLTKAIISSASVALDKLQTLILVQHSKTESLINSLLNGVIMFDENGKIVFVNPAATSFLDLKTIPKNLDGLLKLLPIKNLKRIIQNTQKRGKTAFLEDCKIKSRYYEIYIVAVKDFRKKIVGVAFIIHDITQRKQIEKMKSEFVSITSHQLRTPLTAIRLFSDMMANGEVGKLTKKQKEYLNNIRQSTERMIKLVNDLLNISRIESGRLMINPQPIDLFKLINNIITETLPLSNNKKIKIIFKKSTKKWPKINLDQNLIRQVIHNLIVNAIRYSDNGSKVEVSVQKYSSKYFLIKVKDQGIGIPKEAQDRIFEKFFRADNAIKQATEGSGLGLYVSKMIIEASGGKIWFKSQKNKGTTFFVLLPFSGMKPKKGDKTLAIS